MPKTKTVIVSKKQEHEKKEIEIKKKAKRGWDEIESLFEDHKAKKKQEKEEHEEHVKQTKLRRKEANNKNIHMKTSHKTTNGGGGWVDDGLGGVYNHEGYTGRVEDGVRIFKAHVLRQPDAGQTPDCPFDCQCCFI